MNLKLVAKGKGGYAGMPNVTYFFVTFINKKGRQETLKFKTIKDQENFIAREIDGQVAEK